MKQIRPINLINGEKGERFAETYLLNKGFLIKARNYRKKWGELDIVAQKNGTIHFVEVKTVTHETRLVVNSGSDHFRPEDNVHSWKIKRLKRVIQSYLAEIGLSIESNWQFDLVTIYLMEKNYKIYYFDDLVL